MAENTSNAPKASTLIFLHQLHEQQVTAKVRFLCCVLDYDAKTGCLLVEHKYNQDETASHRTSAVIDINLVLESTKPICLQKGSWINVLGYVEHIPRVKSHKLQSNTKSTDTAKLCRVQAVLVWEAGAVRVDKYEEVVKQHLSLRQ